MGKKFIYYSRYELPYNGIFKTNFLKRDSWFNKCYKKKNIPSERHKPFISAESIPRKIRISNIKKVLTDIPFNFQQLINIPHFKRMNNLSKVNARTLYESIQCHQKTNHNLVKQTIGNWNLEEQTIKKQIMRYIYNLDMREKVIKNEIDKIVFSRKKDRWNCQNVINTYSNTKNHPKEINNKEKSERKYWKNNIFIRKAKKTCLECCYTQ